MVSSCGFIGGFLVEGVIGGSGLSSIGGERRLLWLRVDKRERDEGD